MLIITTTKLINKSNNKEENLPHRWYIYYLCAHIRVKIADGWLFPECSEFS